MFKNNKPGLENNQDTNLIPLNNFLSNFFKTIINSFAIVIITM